MRLISLKRLLPVLLPVLFLWGCRDKSQLVTTDDGTIQQNEIKTGIQVLAPGAGENYTAGDEITIRWQATQDIRYVNMLLYRKDELELSIIVGADNNGEYIWEIPNGLAASEHYRIRISNYQSNQQFSFSEEFKIE